DAIDDQLSEIGPELDDRGYFLDSAVRQRTLGERLSIMLTDARRRITDIPRKLTSRAYGTPLLAILALVGLLVTPWTRRRAISEIVLFGYVGALFVSLTTVYHFWDRYAFGFVPVVAVWAGHGLAVSGALLARATRARRVA